ncbi:conserved protein of unknown function [Methylacidimicrobium sp. AP8]|uniref:hypothetical protein n=1 Tax=Methylacidimicrobium sp. AP8 TaxID=2730359 RepID=UPI0018C1BD4A|nr:hypothetical protein [Methylacidimicrobium sp. AP8]CAB4243946.1 conserved protein of unknown function [Methylacidimicrobium sp. AP8]
MSFRYRSDQIIEIVRAEKVFRHGQTELTFTRYGEKGRRFDADLDLKEGILVDLRLHVRGGVVDEPATYEAALLPAGVRVRGIGYSPTRRRRFHKDYVPKGWHENRIDPSLSGRDAGRNRHEPLADFAPTDLIDFFRKVCHHWRIQSIPEGELL